MQAVMFIGKKTGKELRKFTMSEEEFRSLDSDYCGLCIACGEVACEVEPDARRYRCASCSLASVYGLQELLHMGYLSFEVSHNATAEVRQ